MKLNELIIKGKERYDYKDVATELSWYAHERPGKLIKTNIEGITLDVKKRESRFDESEHRGYNVIILDENTPVGFVYFVNSLSIQFYNPKSSKKLPPDTWTPHSGILKSHTGKGYISAVYRWFLDAGHNLITGDEQTAASNSMWRSLSKHYKLQFIDSNGDVINDITPEKAQEPDTRMMLIGKGNHGLKEEQLQELAEKDIPYEVTYESPRFFSTEGVVGGRKIKFTASHVMQEWGIEFSELRDDDRRTYKATGSGAQFDVLSLVVRSLKEFIARYQPDSMHFTAESGRRASIYKRAMSKYIQGFKEVDKDVHGYKLDHDAIRFVRK